MSDHADMADGKIYASVDAAVAAVRRRPELVADGRCHFCEELVPHGARFCDQDCRDDHEKEVAGLRRAGRRL
jgi:hypothetical protein